MPGSKRTGDQYEEDLHVRVAAYLKHVLPDDVVWWHTPNGARYDPKNAAATAALMDMMGLLPGIPDILILYRGRLYGFDLKSRSGTASAAQIDTAARLVAADAEIFDPKVPVRTLEQVEGLLTEWGMPLAFSYRDLKDKHFMTPRQAQAMSAIALADKGLKARRQTKFGRTASAKLPRNTAQKKTIASR